MRILVGIFVLLVGLLVTGTLVLSRPDGGGSASDVTTAVLAGKAQGHVYTGATEEPADVNPLTARSAVTRSQVLGFTHDTLLDRDSRTGALRPALAVHHEVSADGGACTFTLRDDVVFADGSVMTMADVLFCWEVAQAGHLPMGFLGGALGRVKAAEALDEHRLRVEFAQPHFANVAAVGEGWLVVQQQFFVDRVRRQLSPGDPVPAITSRRFAELLDQVDGECGPGTGPYVLHNDPRGRREWRPREELLMVRHEASWRREVRPGTWNFSAIRLLFRDQNGARNALMLGRLDWYSGADCNELVAAHDQVAAGYDKRVYDFPQLGVYRIVWNCRQGPLQDVRVRRALGMLVPREQIVEVLHGDGSPAIAHAKPGGDCYPDMEPLPFDPPAARRLLREAGFDPEAGKPLRITLLALRGSETLRRITELYRDAAGRAGIDLTVHARELRQFLAEQKRNQWHGSLVLQWFDNTGDPYRFLHSDGRSNPGAWSHPEADRLADAGRAARDADARALIWKQLHELAHREQPCALIVHPKAAVLLARRLQDYVPGAFGLRPEWAWVKPREQRQ